MENQRPKTSGYHLEGNTHYWNEEDDDTNRPLSERLQSGRPQTRVERPVSRRGVQNEPLREPNAFVAVTPTRSSMRPPSASMYSGRGNTAHGRLNTMTSSIAMNRLHTGIPPTAHANSGMMERPVTQHGIATIRPGTTRGLTRQIQDKRYYEGLVQIKIRELTQEISTITREIDSQNKQRGTFVHYDDRAKTLASELTDLQGELADYNIVIDKVTSNMDKDVMEREASDLRALNDKATEEIEILFEQRRFKEQQLREMESKIELEQRKEERIVDGMELDIRDKYEQLKKLRNVLESEISQLQKEIDGLSNKKLNLEEQIALSQVKQEAVKLRVKISEIEEKRDRLQEEQRNKLTPGEEREKLLSKVKQDNMDIAAAEKRIEEVKKHIKQVEQEMEQLDMDMEENHSEKQVKYNELRKREEAIEQFMPTFDHNKAEEIHKIIRFEENIADVLKRLTFVIDNECEQFGIDEFAVLNIDSNEETQDVSFSSLCKEHMKLHKAFKKIKSLNEKLKAELFELRNKIDTKEDELIDLEDLDGLKIKSQMEYEELESKKEDLKRRQPILEKELKLVRKEHQTLKRELNKSEIYTQINALEEKYNILKNENDKIGKFIHEGKHRTDYLPLKAKVFSLVQSYNDYLKENPKSVY